MLLHPHPSEFLLWHGPCTHNDAPSPWMANEWKWNLFPFCPLYSNFEQVLLYAPYQRAHTLPDGHVSVWDIAPRSHYDTIIVWLPGFPVPHSLLPPLCSMFKDVSVLTNGPQRPSIGLHNSLCNGPCPLLPGRPSSVFRGTFYRSYTCLTWALNVLVSAACKIPYSLGSFALVSSSNLCHLLETSSSGSFGAPGKGQTTQQHTNIPREFFFLSFYHIRLNFWSCPLWVCSYASDSGFSSFHVCPLYSRLLHRAQSCFMVKVKRFH